MVGAEFARSQDKFNGNIMRAGHAGRIAELGREYLPVRGTRHRPGARRMASRAQAPDGDVPDMATGCGAAALPA
jgi:hypothetical protein